MLKKDTKNDINCKKVNSKLSTVEEINREIGERPKLGVTKRAKKKVQERESKAREKRIKKKTDKLKQKQGR